MEASLSSTGRASARRPGAPGTWPRAGPAAFGVPLGVARRGAWAGLPGFPGWLQYKVHHSLQLRCPAGGTMQTPSILSALLRHEDYTSSAMCPLRELVASPRGRGRPRRPTRAAAQDALLHVPVVLSSLLSPPAYSAAPGYLTDHLSRRPTELERLRRAPVGWRLNRRMEPAQTDRTPQPPAACPAARGTSIHQ
ncbi:hypothetical protein ACCO45_004041 [Purpureocillium lilacinum]|uniref:Uncharacterized protein n=1 Tax=Purpureocillium lilacinum TaxID=33203 RepID=A0ACC4E2G6_PURLI